MKGNLAIRFNYKNDVSEKFKRFRKNGGFDYIPCDDFFGNKYNGYIIITRNTEVTSPRNVYEKTIMKRKEKLFRSS